MYAVIDFVLAIYVFLQEKSVMVMQNFCTSLSETVFAFPS